MQNRSLLLVGPLVLGVSLLHCVGDSPTTDQPVEAGADSSSTDAGPTEDGNVLVMGGGGDASKGDASVGDAGPPKPVGDVEWAKNFETSASETTVAPIPSGGWIVAGQYKSAFTAGATPLATDGKGDAFVLKLDATGTVVWARRLSSDGVDTASAVAVDSSGAVYVVGAFAGTSIDIGGKTVTRTGANDGFYVKLDATGAPLWGQDLKDTPCTAVAVTGAAVSVACSDASQAVVSSIPSADATGKATWTTHLTSTSGTLVVRGIGVDSASNVYVSGSYSGKTVLQDGTIIAGSDLKGTDENAFLGKLAAGGGGLAFLRNYGPSGATGFATGFGLALDEAHGAIYTVGFFTVTNFGSGDVTSVGGGNADDAFVLKHSMTGDLLWHKTMGGADPDEMYGVGVDDWGGVYVLGLMDTNTSFNVDAVSITSGFGFFELRLDPAGGVALWSRTRASAQGAYGNALAVGRDGHSVVAGRFTGAVDGVPPATLTAASPPDALFLGVRP